MKRHKNPTIVSCLLLLLLWVPSANAEWQEHGIPVCTAAGHQNNESVVIIPDGAGGSIIVWEDERSGESDIYAQRVDALGVPQWAPNGIPVCTAATVQQNPIAVPDGNGGAVIVWEDYRNHTAEDGRVELWAQRIAASGGIHWDADGKRIYTYPDEKNQHADIITDGNGGAIVVWERRELSQSRTYCQRIDRNGNKVWINPDTGEIYKDWEAKRIVSGGKDPKITTDGAGGAIIVWPGNEQILVQRVLSNGSSAWPYGGTPITTKSAGSSPQRDFPTLISDGAGGAIITYTDDRSGDMDIYAQRIDSNHNILWTENGVLVCGAGGNQTSPVISSDGAGGAIISWIDMRSESHGDIYIRKITSSGSPHWPTNGVPICTVAGIQYSHGHIADGNGGAIVTWYDWRYGSWGIYAQNVNTSGAVQWMTDGIPIYIVYSSERKKPVLISDGVGGAIFAWEDERSGNFDIYADRINAQGSRPVATLLRYYSAELEAGCITVNWNLLEAGKDMEFFILRDAGSETFKEISMPQISREGLSFEFRDKECEPENTYSYRVDVSDENGRRVLFETRPIPIPALPLTLYQNHPNPFNPSTTIKYYLPGKCHVTLDIYDISGRKIARLIDRNQPKGHFDLKWNGRDNKGNPASSGIYFYSLKAGKETVSKKMILLR